VNKYAKYTSYVLRHKWFVFLECVKLGIPLRGVLHDMSKLRPSEFFPYVNFFGGDVKSRRDKTGYYKATNTGDPAFDKAWFFHQKRNDHHWQYWVVPEVAGAVAVEMPNSCRREMVADWRGAGRAQGKPDTLGWYTANKDKMVLGVETRAWVEKEIGYTP